MSKQCFTSPAILAGPLIAGIFLYMMSVDYISFSVAISDMLFAGWAA